MKKFINKKPFIICELSGNHNGKINNAKKLMFLAKKSGADCIKLQTYSPEMMTLKSLNYKIKEGLWKKRKLWDLYKQAQTPLSWHKELFNYAKKIKIKIFSTPFSPVALDLLEKLNCPIYKISSFEMNDHNLVKKVASTKKPMIISTGLANLSEIEKTYKIAKKFGCKDISLLYCVSNYPSTNLDFNLNNIKILKEKFNCEVGLSDHSVGHEIAEYATILGATIFEKHIILPNQKKGFDVKFSLETNKISLYKKKIINSYQLIKKEKFYRSNAELSNRIFRRSIYVVENIKKGEIFSEKNIKSLRPNIGLSSEFYLNLLGKKSLTNLKKNRVLNKNLKVKLKLR
tara:strand:- start:3724 stop:4755 length:1032 start_codon:yes stop_codon:yes gene_type:complete